MRNLVVSCAVVVLVGIGALALSAPQATSADPRVAIERSLDYLEREGFAWMDGRVPIQEGAKCVSCHQVGYTVWSLREAQRRGIERPETQVDLLESRAHTFLNEADCRAASCFPFLFARDRAAEGPDTGTLSAQIVEIQEEEGHWRARGQYPTQLRPIEESDAVTTRWTMLALDAFGAPDAERNSRVAAASWLRDAEAGESTEWLLTGMLVEHGAGNRAGAGAFRSKLLERQQADGGWAFKSDQPSDAMTTGQAVYALAIAGEAGTRASLERGVAYLLSTQEADGTWITSSTLISAEPSPGKDYVYTFWGTSWASIGLSRALDVLSEP